MVVGLMEGHRDPLKSYKFLVFESIEYQRKSFVIYKLYTLFLANFFKWDNFILKLFTSYIWIVQAQYMFLTRFGFCECNEWLLKVKIRVVCVGKFLNINAY